MPFTPQQRSMAILGGVFGGGLLITFLLVSLVSGGDDDKRRVSIGPNEPTSTSTTTTVPPTVATATTTLPPPTLPVTNPTTPNTVTPGTVAVVTTSPPATSPPSPGTTKPPTTTTTVKPKTTAEQLEESLEAALQGDGEPPPPGTPPRVTVSIDEEDNEVRVRWRLDESLSAEEQQYQSRYEATLMLAIMKDFDGLDDAAIELRGTVSDEPPPGNRKRLVYVRYERATLDGIDFGTFDPLTVFETPPADDADIDDSLEPTPPATTTTSSTTTTT
jgi:hypothetical protein